MGGVCIDKLPHSCGTRQGLQVFADPETNKVNGYCYSCQTYVANPYGKEVKADDVELPEPKTQEEIELELAEVSGLPCVDVRTRKLRAEHLDHFGIKVALSEEDGKTPTALYYPMWVGGKNSGYYVRTLPDKNGDKKYQWSVGEVKKAEPFGWQQAKRSGAYTLIIVEGKDDAPAVRQIFARHQKNEDYAPAVIALPNGTNSTESSLNQIAKEAERTFKQIIICMDDDKAGWKATEQAMQIFPSALSVTLPEKDPNDCILKGATKAAYKAMAFNASKPKNTRIIVAGDELHQSAREPTPFGQITWPYPSMQKLLRGIRLGETIYVGAGVKMGKSELVNDLGAHFIKEGWPVFMAKPEEENRKTYKMVCGKVSSKIFHDPEVEFDYEAYDKAGAVVKDKLFLVDLYQHMGWESLKRDIVEASSLGAKVIFIDPITNLTNGMNSADANVKLQEIAQDLSAMALDLGLAIFIFCHLRAPEGNLSGDARAKKYREGKYHQLGNCPHEKGGDVLSSQFAGSRAMMRSCNLMVGLEGNKDSSLEEEVRNMRWLTILEDREFGNSASVPLFWNKNTTRFKEVER